MTHSNIKTNTAVVAILVNKNDVLLMQRSNPPICWGPPSGRVDHNETLENALIREVKEETGLDCEIILPVSKWKGKHEEELLKSITFVCITPNRQVILSEEHSEYAWVPIVDLVRWQNKCDMAISTWPTLIKTAMRAKKTILLRT